MQTGYYWKFFSEINQTLRSNPQLGVYLRWQKTAEFECSRCGQGCRTPWRIEVPESYYQLWGTRLSQYFRQPVAELFEVLPEGDSQRYAALKKSPADPQACVFLNPEQLCQIHAELGPEAKPPVCQQYPFNGSRMDWPFYQSDGLALSCRTVARELGQASPLQIKWQPLTPQSPPQVAFQLSSGLLLNREAFHLTLGGLLDLLEQPVSQWLNLMQGFVRIACLLRQPVLDVPVLRAIYAQLSFQTLQPLRPEARAALQTFFREQTIGSKADLQPFKAWLGSQAGPQSLTGSQAQSLAPALKGWLQRQFIAANHLLSGDLNLVQQVLVWSLEVTFICKYLLFLAETAENYAPEVRQARAINQIYAHLVQDHFPQAIRVYQPLSTEALLEWLEKLAQNWAELWPVP